MRRWRDEDRQPFASLNADPQVMRAFPNRLDRAASDELAHRADAYFDLLGVGLWALEVEKSGEFIGFTGLMPMPRGVPGEGGMEIGWRLARQAWGHGYATEAAKAAIRFGVARVPLDEIWSLTAVINARSIAVMQRLGMRRVAVCDHPKVAAGSPLRPHVVYHLAVSDAPWLQTGRAPEGHPAAELWLDREIAGQRPPDL